MRNIKIGGAVIVIILVIGLLFFNSKNDPAQVAEMDTGGGATYLGKNASVIRYKIDGGYTDYAFMSFPFIKNTNREWFAQGFIDLNHDGVFSEEEWMVKNSKARVIANFPGRFSFTLPEELKEGDTENVKILLALTSEIMGLTVDLKNPDLILLQVPVETIEIVDEFGLNVPGASEELKRGIGIPLAYAQDFEETGIEASSLPDLSGGPMDCFAIATANNLINMATQHGRRDDLPEDTQEIIEDLKNAMQWKDGIIGPDFLTGKADYVAAYDLPITTEEIKRPSMMDLAEAFASGDAVEVSTTMIRSASGKKNTGHVLTGVSAYNDGEEGGLAVHDPATPKGTDTLDLSMSGGDDPFILVKYPMWDGVVFIDAIYVQHWNENTEGEDDSGVSLDEQTDISVGSEPIDYKGVGVEMTFAHVKPGEYSEVYVVVTDLPQRSDVTARLTGGGHDRTPQVVTVDENGVAHFTYRISQYGVYGVSIEDIDGNEIGTGSVIVN